MRVRCFVAVVAVLAAPGALAGGDSAGVARQSMCDDAFALCVEAPIAGPLCTRDTATVACVSARVARDRACLWAVDICLKTGGFPVPEQQGEDRQ